MSTATECHVLDIFIGEGVILDRSVYSDSVFANVGRSEGYISEEGKFVLADTLIRCSCGYLV